MAASGDSARDAFAFGCCCCIIELIYFNFLVAVSYLLILSNILFLRAYFYEIKHSPRVQTQINLVLESQVRKSALSRTVRSLALSAAAVTVVAGISLSLFISHTNKQPKPPCSSRS